MTTTTAAIRVLLVDDSALVRRGVHSVIATHSPEGAIEVIGEAAGAVSALAEVRRLRPDVVLLDIRLPDGSGVDVCREILRDFPATRVLMLTSFVDDTLVYDAVIAGAHGYLMKEVDPAGLLEAITSVAAGKSVLTPDVTNRVLRLIRDDPAAGSVDLSSLSAQETRVLALVSDGLTNKEVGEKLTLSENTVKNYLVNIFEKLHVKRRSQAAALYAQAQRPKQ
ncbi:MAG: response regulator transcription factor [Proteobacteria bacterium]|nr:response regulator transcription factor [Pseudomonadota bacterium]